MGNSDIECSLSRLEDCRRRTVAAAEDALRLWEVWKTFNDAGELRSIVARSPASLAATVYETAALNGLVMIVVRLLDYPKPDRLSFRNAQQQLCLPGVSETLIADAPHSLTALFAPDMKAEAAMEATRDRIAAFHARLDKLDTERPNRTRLLRDHRHENLGHELRANPARVKPTYDQLEGMVFETLALAQDLQAIVTGSVHFESMQRGDAESSTIQLWRAVAAAFPYDKRCGENHR